MDFIVYLFVNFKVNYMIFYNNLFDKNDKDDNFKQVMNDHI